MANLSKAVCRMPAACPGGVGVRECEGLSWLEGPESVFTLQVPDPVQS